MTVEVINGEGGIPIDKLLSIIILLESQWPSNMLADTVFLKQYTNKIYQNAILLGLKSEEDQICGIAAVYANDINGKQAYLTYIALMNRFCGQGYGKKLLNECERYAMDYGMDTIKLEVKTTNVNALHFYKKNGYQYDSNASVNSIYMIKRLEKRND